MGSGRRTRRKQRRKERKAARISLRRIASETFATLRGGWPILLVAGIAIYVPIGLVQALDPIELITDDDLGMAAAAELVLLLIAQIAIPMIGSVLYSGIAAGVLVEGREDADQSLWELARSLPYGRLILADVALALVTIAGYIALIVPGLVFTVWFALIAPVIDFEDLSVRRAFARSRALVRPHFRLVALTVLALVAFQAAAEGAGSDLIPGLLGGGYLPSALGGLFSNLITAPVYALAVITLYLHLRAARPHDSAAPFRGSRMPA